MYNSNINRENKFLDNNKMAINIIMFISIILGIGYIAVLATSINSKRISSEDIILFIKIFELILALVAIVSCILCYNSTKKEELFIISLMYIVFFVDILLGNVDNMGIDDSKINMDEYITILTSILRVSILLISISPFKNFKKLIVDNKLKSIVTVVFIAALIGLFKNKNIIHIYFKDLQHFTNYNLFLMIIYIIVCIAYLIKSIKYNEYIYSVISASIFFFIIKALYAVIASIKDLSSIKIISISITYTGFIVLIGGIICELLLTLRRNKELENELSIFKKIADEARYSCILIFDELKNIGYLNTKAKNYFEIDDEDSYAQILEKVNILNPQVGKEKEDEIKTHLLQLGFWKGTIESTINGGTISCSIQKIYVHDIKNTVVIFNDITNRLRTKKFLIEYEKMKNQEQVRNEFFANISHELRTPLNIFYSTVQLLDMKNQTNPTEFSDIYSNHAQSLKINSKRMLRLINNIVDITKIDVGFIKPKFVNCNIINLVEDITLSVLNYAEPKKINIVFDTEIEEHIIKCDKDMIERAMLNLLSNSIKFTNSNGNILVKMYVDEKWVHIIIKDDGVGIPIEIQGTIFDRFIQNDKSLTRLNEGSGIGLSIVKSAIKLTEGEIYLESDGENGTEFEILLPNKKLDGYDTQDEIYKVDVSNIELELSDIYELYN